LHEQIGNAVEEIYRDNIEAYYGVLAEHYITSENYEKGAEYSRLAERKTEKAGSLVDAIEYARKRIKCLEKLPQSDELQKELIDARTVLGLYSIQIGYHAAAKEAVQPILDLANAGGYKRRLSQIYTIMGTYHFQVEEDFDKAFNYLEDALIISQELNDMVSILFSNFWLAIVRSVNCEFERAVSHFDKALEINLAANSLWGTSIMKSNLSYFIFYFQGGVGLSYQTSKEALQGANASGDIFSKAMALVCHGIACYGRGLFAKAIDHLSEGRKFCEKINLVIFHALAHFFLGESYFEMGDFETPKEHFSTATRILKHNQIIPSWKNTNKLAMAKTKVMNGERDIDLQSLYNLVNDNKAKIWDGWIRRCVGEILLNIDEHHMVEAQDWIIRSIEADQNNGVLLNLGKDYALYAELLRRKGDSEAAGKKMHKAIELFRNCGADGMLRNAEKKLASIS
jgi:tetratricopeptide (TPR) repeat protein